VCLNSGIQEEYRRILPESLLSTQDYVFPASCAAEAASIINIRSSGDSSNTVWFAPAGTTNFVEGATMTKAAGNATSIIAPYVAGTYKLYILNSQGVKIGESKAILRVSGSANPPSNEPRSAYTRIEAESYSAQSGVQTEECSEGGRDVGYIENGDCVVYKNIDFGSGAASFQARVASATGGGNIEIRIDGINGPLVGTCAVKGTGGWQEWVDTTCEVSGLKGVHDLYLKFTGGDGYLLNLNWFTFVEGKNDEHLGDINDDRSIDSLDLQLLKRHVLRKIQLSGPSLINADVNKDGSIDSMDVTLLKRYILRKIDTF
jgi:hypothetical protein